MRERKLLKYDFETAWYSELERPDIGKFKWILDYIQHVQVVSQEARGKERRDQGRIQKIRKWKIRASCEFWKSTFWFGNAYRYFAKQYSNGDVYFVYNTELIASIANGSGKVTWCTLLRQWSTSSPNLRDLKSCEIFQQ